MPNILKSPARVNAAAHFLEHFYDEGANDVLYIGLGDAGGEWGTPLSPDVPIDSFDEEEAFWANLIGIGKINPATSTELVVPLKEWTSGNTYAVFDESADSGSGSFDVVSGRDFYVKNTEAAPKVYHLLTAGGGASTDEPTHTDPNGVTEADGYEWSYLYTIGAGGHVGATLVTTSWMPVPSITSIGIAPYANSTAYGLGGLAEGDGSGNFEEGQIYQVIATTGSSSGADMDSDANNTWAEWKGDQLIGAFYVGATLDFPDAAGTGGEIPDVGYRQVALLRNPKNSTGGRLTAQWEGADFEATLSRGIVMTIDNRVTVTRQSGQTERVRLILNF